MASVGLSITVIHPHVSKSLVAFPKASTQKKGQSVSKARIGTDKETKQIIKEAKSQGWQIVMTNGNHLKWIAPNGKVVFSALTGSDRRGILNLKSQLRIAGFIEIKKQGKSK
jgi:hypothetical protein